MKVKELIEKLEKANPELIVFCNSSKGEHDYGMVNTAKVDFINFYHPDGREEVDMHVFIIDEE